MWEARYSCRPVRFLFGLDIRGRRAVPVGLFNSFWFRYTWEARCSFTPVRFFFGLDIRGRRASAENDAHEEGERLEQPVLGLGRRGRRHGPQNQVIYANKNY